VKDYQAPADWEGPEPAYRVQIGALDSLVQHADAAHLEALVLASWGIDNGAGVIRALANHRSQLPCLFAILLGDIASEPGVDSHVQYGDVSPLLDAFPQLEVLRVHGGRGLQFSKTRHESLRALIVETRGFPRSAIHEICQCDFPNLIHFELWLGSANLGWDGGLADLQPILDGQRFPNLRHLGLRSSEIADEIASVVISAEILKRLKVLDLSNGKLSDTGGRALLELPWNAPLRQLVVRSRHLSGGMARRLDQELPCEVIAEDSPNPDPN